MDPVTIVLWLLPALVAAGLTAVLIASSRTSSATLDQDPATVADATAARPWAEPGTCLVVALAVTLLGAGVVTMSVGGSALATTGVSVAVIGLGTIGILDEREPMGRVLRTGLLALAAALIVWSVPHAGGIVGLVPSGIGLVLLAAILLGYIRVVEAMSPLVWLPVVAILPLGLAAALMGALAVVPTRVGVVGMTLAGALIGSAPSSEPRAGAPLGTAGRLAIAGLAGWILVEIAAAGHLAATVLLVLYPLAEGLAVLWRRQERGVSIFDGPAAESHRLAIDRGMSEREITDRVLALGLVLAVLAVVIILMSSALVSLSAVAAGLALTAALLSHFERGGV